MGDWADHLRGATLMLSEKHTLLVGMSAVIEGELPIGGLSSSAALFQFMWSTNDFMGPLLYVSTPKRYPAAIFVKMSMDADTGFSWNRILALSLISIIPSLVVFFLAQDQFIDGVTAGSVKG